MRRRGVPSPDEGDAVALCFAGPAGAVVDTKPRLNLEPYRPRIGGGGHGWLLA